jgi:hypothetical protein
MQQDEVAQRIFHSAEQYAKEHGMRLGQGAENDFQRYAGIAAADLVQHTDGSLEARTMAMEAVFERLVDEMIEASKRIKDYQKHYPGVIGEQTLYAALEKLCPLFPFC